MHVLKLRTLISAEFHGNAPVSSTVILTPTDHISHNSQPQFSRDTSGDIYSLLPTGVRDLL